MKLQERVEKCSRLKTFRVSDERELCITLTMERFLTIFWHSNNTEKSESLLPFYTIACLVLTAPSNTSEQRALAFERAFCLENHRILLSIVGEQHEIPFSSHFVYIGRLVIQLPSTSRIMKVVSCFVQIRDTFREPFSVPSNNPMILRSFAVDVAFLP